MWDPINQRIERKLIECNYELWGCSKLGADFRNFLFKFVQGRLYLNNVLHRIDNSPPQCTFCLISAKKQLIERGIGENDPEFMYLINLQPVESVDHIFWTCEKIQGLIQMCYRWILGLDWYRGPEVIGKEKFFVGTFHESKMLMQTDLLWKHYLKFLIYNARMLKKIPQFAMVRFEMEGLFNNRGMGTYRNRLNLLTTLYP